MTEKKFAFVNAAAEREYKDLPKDIQSEFGTSLRAIQKNKGSGLNLLLCMNISSKFDFIN